jgi:DNA-binding cell septation regulator SpoVG
MRTKILSFSSSTKTHVLASVKLELITSEGDSIIVDDCRVLQNKHGQFWLAMPTRSVPLGSKGYEYVPTIILSTKLRREVEDVVIPAYEKWAATQTLPSGGAR